MPALVRPRFVPPPYQDSAGTGRLILRDGTTAHVRPAGPDDRDALTEFFWDLSPESRARRFLSLVVPGRELMDRLCRVRPARRAHPAGHPGARRPAAGGRHRVVPAHRS